jgi:hypothetical protein
MLRTLLKHDFLLLIPKQSLFLNLQPALLKQNASIPSGFLVLVFLGLHLYEVAP